MMQQLECFSHPVLTRTFSCEAELEELMHQIDIMVNNKKLEWERQAQVLETKLDAREKELINSQNAMDQKIREMEILHQKLEDVEKSQCEMAQSYEGQLQTLKFQLSKLKHSYEKLQLHHKKQVGSYRTEQSLECDSTQSELNRLNQKLKEFKAKSKEWEKQRILYQNQLGTLDHQRKSLAEKCKLFQKQSQNHHTWLTGRRPFQDSSFTSLSEIRHLREQLHTSQKNIMSSEGIITKLKSDMNEEAMSKTKLQEENQRLLQELKKCQRQFQNLESDFSEVKTELQLREDLLSAVEVEQMHMHKELAKFRIYRSIEENTKSLGSSHTQSLKLNEIQLLKKKMAFHISELHKVRNLLFYQTQPHSFDENSDLIVKFHQKDNTKATIVDKSDFLEGPLITEVEMKEKNIFKQQGIKSLKEQESYTTLEKLQYENGKLQNDFIKAQAKLELPSESGHEKPEESPNYSVHDITEIKASENMFQQENNWELKTELLQSTRNCIKSLTLHNETGDIAVSSSWDDPSENIFRNPEVAAGGVTKVSIVGCLPNQDTPNLSLLSQYCHGDNITCTLSSPETSFPNTAIEKFFQEEDKRAKEFEKILNAHIEELQKNSQKILCKASHLNQIRHVTH
uniref:Deuterosome assembly protein 1 n=1 Tax=Geotrypetes seraphini TaxID=260995 RepID=A0A6P8R8G5_GEOSA|nr:deuterosome assembly protein 1 isoform X2 [Geotrypetes seraphini]XP_033804510.1 deuterosome assembly protein 1 isoform X2 [Geotrypetes seraphini]XP_033804511.1 deuterosome assembly protein 1 isoform X2 [Geotrypetes seraphini]